MDKQLKQSICIFILILAAFLFPIKIFGYFATPNKNAGIQNMAAPPLDFIQTQNENFNSGGETINTNPLSKDATNSIGEGFKGVTVFLYVVLPVLIIGLVFLVLKRMWYN